MPASGSQLVYTKVFDAATQPYSWQFGSIGLIFFVIGIVLLVTHLGLHRRGYRNLEVTKLRLLGTAFVIFGPAWTSIVDESTYSKYRRVLEAEHIRALSTVKGSVRNFRVIPPEGTKWEEFTVADQNFAYTQDDINPGFHHTRKHGGPISSGLPVSIDYLNDSGKNIIVRLSIGHAAGAAQR